VCRSPSDPCKIHTCMSKLHYVLCARSKRTKTTNIAKANDSEREKMREKRISKLESDANDDAGNDDVDDDDDFDVRLSIPSVARMAYSLGDMVVVLLSTCAGVGFRWRCWRQETGFNQTPQFQTERPE
jgi:hypothetical protein